MGQMVHLPYAMTYGRTPEDSTQPSATLTVKEVGVGQDAGARGLHLREHAAAHEVLHQGGRRQGSANA